ncbi:hypothetical protein [Xanthomonas fragariae]|uniref:hypothetical protein n=1 Tax=Xanthomonas fragariae TaxID=48664 RepID=UPI001F47312D|nr:hypothetical protein [Xanthomonas fragariae]
MNGATRNEGLECLRNPGRINLLRAANAKNPLRAAYQSVVADPLINPVDARDGRGAPEISHHYGVMKTLFLQNTEAPAFIHVVDQGANHAFGRPHAERNHQFTAGLNVYGNDLVVWNRDGQGHAFVGGVWSDAPRENLVRVLHQDGTTDIIRNSSDGSSELLLHIDPRAAPLRGLR